MIKTRLCEQFGLAAPIVSAGMAFVGGPELAAAVSTAGGLGTLGASPAPPPALREMIRATRALTSRPFGVNFITPFTTDEHIELCIEQRVRVVSFHWDDPNPRWIRRLRDGGIDVWMQAGSVALARRAVDAGARAIVAQGSEAGGHNRGTCGTMVLVPAIVDAVAPVPVLAAGGIADGRGLAAALALGADAAWIGTRLLASREAFAHDQYKRRVVGAAEGDTIRTTLFGPEWPGAQARVLKNGVVCRWAGREDEATNDSDAGATARIGHTRLAGQDVPMPRFSALLPTPHTTGDFEQMCLAAGESSLLVDSIEPADRIVQRIASEAEQILRQRLAAMVQVDPTMR